MLFFTKLDGLKKWNVSNVNDFSNMFNEYSSLQKLDGLKNGMSLM